MIKPCSKCRAVFTLSEEQEEHTKKYGPSGYLCNDCKEKK